MPRGWRCLTRGEAVLHPGICMVCKERQPALHPGAILAPARGRVDRPFPRCPGCGRVLGRCPSCGSSWAHCECPAPFLEER